MTDKTKVLFQLTEHVKFAHKVVVIKQHDGQARALVVKRSAAEKTRPNCWDLPGGNMEWPTADQSSTDLHRAEVVREVSEETGIVLAADQLTTQNLVYFETYFDQPAQVFKIYCGWGVRLPQAKSDDKVKLSAEHQGFAWISLDEIKSYDFGGAAGAFLTRHLAQALQ